MKQIESFRTASLRNNEDYGFHTLVIKALSYLPVVSEGTTDPLKATRENYVSRFEAFDKAYMQNNKLDEVEVLSAADTAVDEAICCKRYRVISTVFWNRFTLRNGEIIFLKRQMHWRMR